eukprot:711160-Prorocentrum_lima.AAC.1
MPCVQALVRRRLKGRACRVAGHIPRTERILGGRLSGLSASRPLGTKTRRHFVQATWRLPKS